MLSRLLIVAFLASAGVHAAEEETASAAYAEEVRRRSTAHGVELDGGESCAVGCFCCMLTRDCGAPRASLPSHLHSRLAALIEHHGTHETSYCTFFSLFSGMIGMYKRGGLERPSA